MNAYGYNTMYNGKEENNVCGIRIAVCLSKWVQENHLFGIEKEDAVSSLTFILMVDFLMTLLKITKFKKFI